MKQKLQYIRMTIPVLFFVLAGLTSCDIFLIPQADRTNPYDPYSVVAAVSNFQAAATDQTSVQITWDVPAERAPASLTIVRKEGSFPATSNDGYKMTGIDVNDGSYSDTGLSQDTTYYYAVWSVSDDGVEVGPLYDDADTTLKEAVIYPSLSGHLDDSDVIDVSNADIYVGGTVPIYIGLLKFNLDGISSSIVSAELYLYCSTSFGNTIYIDPIISDWDDSGSLTYSEANSANFADSSHRASFSETSGVNTRDVLEAVQYLKDNGYNYGLRLTSSGGTESVFNSDYSGYFQNSWPHLTIQYYGD